MQCHKCNVEMVRVKRVKPPKAKQKYYFTEWDKCPKCGCVVVNDAFRVVVVETADDNTAMLDYVLRHGKKNRTCQGNTIFYCAYYALKNMGHFPNSGLNFPSRPKIYTEVFKRCVGARAGMPLEDMLDRLGIEWGEDALASYRTKRKSGNKNSVKRIIVAPPVYNHNYQCDKYIPSEAFFASSAWKSLRYKALELNGGVCQCCGRSRKVHGVVLHVDHIKPRSKFPELQLELSNLQVLCEDCNMGKSNKFCTDWR